MKFVKILLLLLIVYVGIVATFESLIGYFQPADANTLVITTRDTQGNASDRVVSRIETNGALYVAANHWPRAWYQQALQNPAVQVDLGDGKRDYRAVAVTGAEKDRVNAAHPLGPMIRILTGFPPRQFVRLEPSGDL
jgi:hypothetical protein